MKYHTFYIRWIFIILILAICSCDSLQNGNSNEALKPNGIERRFTLGGAPIDVVITLSKEEISITESLVLTVKAEYEEDVQLIPPFLSETTYLPLMLVKPPSENTSWAYEANRMVSIWRYQFEPITSGEFTIKSFQVYFRLESEKTKTGDEWPVHRIDTDEIRYTVTSVEVGEGEDIRDIKDLILPDYDFLPVIITVLAIAGVISLLLFLKRYRHGWIGEQVPGKMKIDYYLEALRKLEALEAQDLISKDEFQALHTQLSHILRSYIESVYGLRAQEQTTEEFIKDISRSSIFTRDQQQMLHQFLSLADLVKFATFDPGVNNSTHALQGVRNFIEMTGRSDEV